MAAAAALSLLDPRFLLPACLIAAAFWPVRRWAVGAWTRRTPADLPVLVILAAAAVSLAVSVDQAASLPQVLRLLGGIALFYAIVNWAVTPARARLLGLGLIGAGLVLGAAAFVIVDWSETKFPFIPAWIYDSIPTLAPDVVHPNVLGGALLLTAPVAAAAVLFGGFGRAWTRWFALAALGWIALVLALSQSRGAVIGLAVGLMLLAALRWRWGWLVFVFAALAAAFGTPLLGADSLADLLFGSRILGGFQGRVEIWARGIFMIQDFPLTGIGFGLFPFVVDRLYPFFTTGAQIPLHAHNLLIQVAVDLGIAGLAGWLAVYIVVLRSGWQTARSGGSLAGLGAAAVAVQAALLVHGLFDAVVWGQIRIAPLVWVVWGFGLAVGNFREQA